MSRYTTEVRFICESLNGLKESKGYEDVDTIIEVARPKIFDFDYPIFDETYKVILETKILNHYYYREIGGETYGLWHHWLKNKMNEIMPYYNQLYESETIKFNPLYDTDYGVDHSGTNGKQTDEAGKSINSAVQNSNTLSDSESRDAYSDTPQGRLQEVEDNLYLTDYRKTGDKADTKTNVASNSENRNNRNMVESAQNQFVNKVLGKRSSKSYSKMLDEFRDTFLNIDMMIINELADLFMNIWE